MADRSRRLRRGVVAALLAPVVACTGSDDGQRAGPDPPPATPTADPARLRPECGPVPEPRKEPTVDQVNRLMGSLDLAHWQAADIGASARLPDGRLVWVFGDTVRREGVEPRLVANSMLVSSGRCVSQLLGPDRGPVIPDAGRHTVRWPMSVVVGRTGGQDVVVVLCSRIRRGDGGSFDFTFLGTSAAVFTVAPGEAPQLTDVVDVTPDSTDPQQVNWGAAVVRDQGWFHVYGTRLTGRDYEFGRELYVARVPEGHAHDRKRWQFWDGQQWQSRVGRAAAVLPSSDGVSQTLSVDRIGDGFVATSKRGGDVADFVWTWTAPNAWGPWTPHQELEAPAGFDTGDLEYAPLAHPEVPLSSGRLLVSVSRNTTDAARLVDDPSLGRPLFVEVTRR
jgi:hypothetical protein